MNKTNLGQFYTKNSAYIIRNFKHLIPKQETIVDPFAGEWDLLNLFKNPKVGFDIDPKTPDTIQRDFLTEPINLKNSWVVTNPPYLARNKNKG